MSSPDVLVVGGGAIGVAAALELVRAGAQVTLLEREAAVGQGCSAGSAGLICPSHAAPLANPAALLQGARWAFDAASPLYLKPRPAVLPWLARFVACSRSTTAERGARVIRELSVLGLAGHARLAADGLPTTFEQRGLLNVYTTAAGLAAGQAEAAVNREHGLAAQVLDAAQARELEPGLATGIAGGVLYPDEAHCDGLEFVRAVATAAAEAGAEIRTAVDVLSIARAGRRAVRLETTDGPIAAGSVVIATGAWAPSLARTLGSFLPVEGGKGYHVELVGAPAPALPLLVHEARVVATPLAGRVRLAGTLELAGLDLSVSRRRVEAVLAAGRRALPALAAARVTRVWRGLRPCAPDGLPIVGRLPRLDNVVVATAHAMMGLTLAPVTGELVRDLVLGAAAPVYDLHPLRPQRFRPLLG